MIPSEFSAKRKTKAHHSSDSSEGSPAQIITTKRRSTMEPLSKSDLIELRAGLKMDLKEELATHLQPLVSRISKIESVVESLQRQVRTNNVIVHGIPADTSENTKKLLVILDNLFKDIGIAGSVLVDNVFRSGSSIPRPLMVKFVRQLDKRSILEKRKELSAKKIYVNDDLTPLQQFNKKLLTTHLKARKSTDPTIWGSIRGNSLLIKKNGNIINRFEVENGIVREISARIIP
jgi:hypothetical protein